LGKYSAEVNCKYSSGSYSGVSGDGGHNSCKNNTEFYKRCGCEVTGMIFLRYVKRAM